MNSKTKLNPEEKIKYFFDEFFVFRGILFSRGWVLHVDGLPVKIKISIKQDVICIDEKQQFLPSSDISKIFGCEYGHCRFNIRLILNSDLYFNCNVRSDFCKNISVIFYFGNEEVRVDNPSKFKIGLDDFNNSGKFFFESLNNIENGKVLEIGSRARSQIIYKSLFPKHLKYVGMDIIVGPNVDVVGDAHELSSIFPKQEFDFIYTNCVFEHIAMPWRVIIEMNKVMKKGGLVMIRSPQTWPIHDEPWDFFRFSKYAWQALLNKATGFEILESVQGIPAHVVPMLYLDNQVLDDQPGWMLTSVVARKINDTELEWNVKIKDILKTFYPE